MTFNPGRHGAGCTETVNVPPRVMFKTSMHPMSVSRQTVIVSPPSGTEIGGSPSRGAAKSNAAPIRWVADSESVWLPDVIVPVFESTSRTSSGPGSLVGVYVRPSRLLPPGTKVAGSPESAKSAPWWRLRLTVTGMFAPPVAIVTGTSATKPSRG
jgi:hypothetical protein